jgi:hypothetical protein
MRNAVAVALLVWASLCQAADPPIPLESGTYKFQWKDAEFSNSAGFPVKVVIDGRRVSVVKEHAGGAAGVCFVAFKTAMWTQVLLARKLARPAE